MSDTIREPTYDYIGRRMKEEQLKEDEEKRFMEENFDPYQDEKETHKVKFPQFSGALDKQVGGQHYKDCAIQPADYIYNNNLDFFEGNIIKYTTRHRKKGEGSKDIRKVIHYAELILQLVYEEKP